MASSNVPFTHLHLHTQYSLLDGAIKHAPLFQRVADLGMPAVGMTDHGNLFGAVGFHEAALAAGVKPIIGCEVYVAQGSRFDRDPETGGVNGINHLVLLAMNDKLNRLIDSEVGKDDGFHLPEIDGVNWAVERFDP